MVNYIIFLTFFTYWNSDDHLESKHHIFTLEVEGILIITFRNNGEVNKEGEKGLHGLSTVKIQDIFVAEDPPGLNTPLKVFLAPSKNGYLLWPLNGVIGWVIS